MKKLLSFALALCLLCTCLLVFASCAQEVSEEEWRAAFAFENVRVDFKMNSWDIEAREWKSEARELEPLYNGTHYLVDGENVAIANAKVRLIGEDEPVLHEQYFIERERLVRSFDFADRFEEFEYLEDGTYFCEFSSLTNLIWYGDCVEEVYVSFSGGKIEKITYTYASSRGGIPTLYTYTFSEYGQVELDPQS